VIKWKKKKRLVIAILCALVVATKVWNVVAKVAAIVKMNVVVKSVTVIVNKN